MTGESLVWEDEKGAWIPLRAHPTLADLLRPLTAPLPPCPRHGERGAAHRESIGLCAGCNEPFCHECLTLKGSLHLCPACLPRLLAIRLTGIAPGAAETGGTSIIGTSLMRTVREKPALAAGFVLFFLALAMTGWSSLTAEPPPGAPAEDLVFFARRYYYQGARLHLLAQAFEDIGETQAGRGYHEGSIRAYRETIRKYPASTVAAWAHVRLGEILETTAEGAGVETLLHDHIEANPGSEVALYARLKLGSACLERKSYAMALKHLDAAIASAGGFEDGQIFGDPFEVLEAGGYPSPKRPDGAGAGSRNDRVFLPYDVEVEYPRPPVFTWGLMGLLVLVHAGVVFLPESLQTIAVLRLGCVPDELNLYTPFTCLLLHGDVFHLAGNLLYLWVFGRAVEIRLGATRYLLLFFGYGAVASLVHVFLSPVYQGDIPVIGASGAISALLGSFWVLYPKQKIKIWYFFGRIGTFRAGAIWILALWFAWQFLEGLYAQYVGSVGTAFWAHVGGFAAGAGGSLALRYGKDFERAIESQGAETRLEELNGLIRAGRAEKAVPLFAEIRPNLAAHPAAGLEEARALLLVGRSAEGGRAMRGLLENSLACNDDALSANAFYGVIRSGGLGALHPELLLKSGLALRRKKRPREAIEAFARASENPSLARRDQALFNLGELLLENGRDVAGAEECFRRIPAEFPESRLCEDARYLLTWIENARG